MKNSILIDMAQNNPPPPIYNNELFYPDMIRLKRTMPGSVELRHTLFKLFKFNFNQKEKNILNRTL